MLPSSIYTSVLQYEGYLLGSLVEQIPIWSECSGRDKSTQHFYQANFTFLHQEASNPYLFYVSV